MPNPPSPVAALLLTRRGRVYPPPADAPPDENLGRVAGLELAALGYLPSQELSTALARLGAVRLADILHTTTATLAAALGADRKHEPMFRRFPQDVPGDTQALWWSRVLVNLLQAPDQPCVLCGRIGTTHVLKPCRHVACDRCFDGSNHAGCPICYAHVDRASPFFTDADFHATERPKERVRFKLLTLGADLDADARELLSSLCARTQALSPADKEALATLVGAYGERALAWIPPAIPVKENVAIVFGTLFRACEPAAVLPLAKRHWKTATDVLRFLAVFSGADPGLLPQTIWRDVPRPTPANPLWTRIVAMFGGDEQIAAKSSPRMPLEIYRFQMAKLRRPLRKALLAVMEGFDADALAEDMLRHRSYWVWAGQFLHPHEFAARFPSVARAFHIVRKKAPDGTPAPEFRTFASKVESALVAKDVARATDLLARRPGELARRLDHLLRTAASEAPDAPDAAATVVDAFRKAIPSLATPMLLTLRAHLPTRLAPAPVRMFWPKTAVFLAPSGRDDRASIPADVVTPVVRALESELLLRFSGKPRFASALVDAGLRSVTVPFNERTASRAAIALTRGSTVPIPPGKTLRLFLHWCEPAEKDARTDLDLSIGIYDASWKLVDVCSYYQQKVVAPSGETVAVSSGDWTSAPPPDGASEFVDFHRDAAVAAGFRYAVMVVNAYAGLPFSLLERAFAGVMLRDDELGHHFDPRTVQLKFALAGPNGVFVPLVVDLATNELHWLDVQSRGQPEMNNVATSNRAIATVVPAMLSYFASGARPSMYDLALLHAAARTDRVRIRKENREVAFERRPGESAEAFFRRLRAGEGAVAPNDEASPVLAALFEGDVDLPAGSASFVLFPGKTTGTLAASDFLA